MVDYQNPGLGPQHDPDEAPPVSKLGKALMLAFWLVVALVLGTTLAVFLGQVGGCASPAQAQQQPVFGEKPPADAGTCVLIFPVGDLSKVLLQAGNRVELDAHEHIIQLRPGTTPLVTCKVYRGIHRPTSPVSKTWQVGEIKFVEMDIFQKLVDEAIGNAEVEQNGDGNPDPFDGNNPATKKTAKGPPVLPTVPLNPNVPR